MLITCNQPNDNTLTDYKSPWYRCVNSCMHSVYLKSKSAFRWKWPSCVNLETSSCTCQTSPALIDKMLIRNEKFPPSSSRHVFIWPVLTTYDSWQYFPFPCFFCFVFKICHQFTQQMKNENDFAHCINHICDQIDVIFFWTSTRCMFQCSFN